MLAQTHPEPSLSLTSSEMSKISLYFVFWELNRPLKLWYPHQTAVGHALSIIILNVTYSVQSNTTLATHHAHAVLKPARARDSYVCVGTVQCMCSGDHFRLTEK